MFREVPLIQYGSLTFAGTIYFQNQHKTKFPFREREYENHSAFRRDLHH